MQFLSITISVCVGGIHLYLLIQVKMKHLWKDTRTYSQQLYTCVRVWGGKCGGAELGEQGTGDEFYCVSFHTFDF